jgi:quaternary ammonium compound-resistance protein SugE
VLLTPSEGFTGLLRASGGCVQRHQRVVLFKTLKRLPVGTAYAAWTGIGSVGVVIGMALFDDPVTAVRIGCIVLIVASIFGRRLVGSGSTGAARVRCAGRV